MQLLSLHQHVGAMQVSLRELVKMLKLVAAAHVPQSRQPNCRGRVATERELQFGNSRCIRSQATGRQVACCCRKYCSWKPSSGYAPIQVAVQQVALSV
jgi:hypothetical protein